MYKIKDFEKTGKKIYLIQRIISILIYAVVIPVIIINFVILIQSYINPNGIPSFFGYKTFVIISKSMEPTIMTGDAIFIKEVPENQIRINDIISFHDQGDMNTHRIIQMTKEKGIINYTTKGDNNKNPDKDRVTYNEVEGVYQFKLNGFGPIADTIKNKATLVVLLIFLILISIHQVNTSKRKLKRQEKRYMYSQQDKTIPQNL